MATENTIALENQLPGTPQSVWGINGPDNIEGFTTDISVNHGNTIDFKINTDSSDYRIEIYRLGYYGGDGARLVDTIQHQSDSFVAQPGPLYDETTGLIDAGNWEITDSWDVPADAVSGAYIAKLVRQDGTVGENHIPFIVRDDEGQSDIVFQTSDSTWQAYNPWGGKALYNLTVFRAPVSLLQLRHMPSAIIDRLQTKASVWAKTFYGDRNIRLFSGSRKAGTMYLTLPT